MRIRLIFVVALSASFVGFSAPSGATPRLDLADRPAVSGAAQELGGMALTHVAGQADNIYYMHPRFSAKCMTVHGNSMVNGAIVDQYRCVGARNQWWIRESATGEVGIWNFRSASSLRCLTVHGASKSDGATIDQWTCGTGTNQMFLWLSDTAMKPRHSLKCVVVNGYSTADNARLIQWPCSGNFNQTWAQSG